MSRAPVTAGGPPAKAPSSVAGASGGAAAPSKVAGDSGPGQTKAGGDAAEGAKALGGGDTGLKAALDGVVAAVKALSDAVSKMGTSGGGGSGSCGAMHGGGARTGVMGVRGSEAASGQFVARSSVVSATATGEDSSFEQRVLELINKERAKAGLAPVAYNAALDNSAEKHARHMSLVGRMAHDGIGDGDPGERARAEGWRRGWGENVAKGQSTPEQVVREWMASPGHRRNILDPSFRVMGVGQVQASNGTNYWAQEFGA